jgi:hypothetical protein
MPQLGAIRVAELTQHLKRNNIHPLVLTVKQESYDRVDSSKPELSERPRRSANSVLEATTTPSKRRLEATLCSEKTPL